MSNENKILSIFLQHIDADKVNITLLKKYIQYCIDNNKTKEKGKTSFHHILPRGNKTPFNQYENLTINAWNGVHLTYYEHYYAHYLLSNAIVLPIYLYIFIAMHNKDRKLKRILESELIPQDEYNTLMCKRNKNISENMLTIINHNGEYMTKAKLSALNRKITPEQLEKMSNRMKGDNNLVHDKNIIDRIRKTKLETYINGKNLDTISAERAAATMKKEFVDESGNITTIYKINGKKLSKHLNTEITLENGTVTTVAKERNKAKGIKMREIGKKYILKNIFDETFSVIKDAIEIREISPGLESKTKENYLGKSKFGYNHFMKINKPTLIGLYVEMLQPNHEHHSHHPH